MENKLTKKTSLTDWFKAGWSGNALFSTAFALLIMVIIQAAVMAINGGSFLAMFGKMGTAWMNLLRNNAYPGIIALGMCFVILSGGIDLSVGSTLCACGAFLMYMLDETASPLAALGLPEPVRFIIAILGTMLLGVLLGEVNGALIAYGKLPPFIATLGTMKIFRSVTQQLTKTFNPTVPDNFKQIASFKILDQVILPILYWVAIVAIMHVVFKRVAFGRQTIAIGSNERAAKLSGINVGRIKRRIYVLCGLMCGIASVVYVARIGSMDFANAGSGYEMDAIAAVIVGGTSMSGGKGSLVGAFLGMLIIGIMNNVLNTIGVPTFLCEAFKGAIIIFAVLLQKKETV